MKILHWVFVFMAIILPVSIVCRNLVNSRFIALRDEVRINNAIDTATKDAIDQIIAVSGFDFDNQFGGVINVTPQLAQEAINTFFCTMAINYNLPFQVNDISSITEEKSYIKNYFATYVPAVVVIAYDGFYIYSQEMTSTGFRYQLSSKIPYTKTYTASNGSLYTVGYTLGDDIYLYFNGNCYSGRMYYNNRNDLIETYTKEYEPIMSSYGSKSAFLNALSTITDDISMILYALSQDTLNGMVAGSELIPAPGVTNFLADSGRDENDVIQEAGPFHTNRRKVIIQIISDCLKEQINEHNSFASMVGSTYQFALPEITNDDWVNSINDISVMAFIQGIPIGTTEGTYFNNFALGGSRIVNRDYLYGAVSEKGHKLYHTKRDCPNMSNAGEDFLIFVTEEDALEEGYLPCLGCN